MYQKLTIVGNLGSDPEMRYLPDGTAVTNFSVATNRRWTDGNGDPKEETTWFRVTAWRKQAESVNQYLARGAKVLVEGTLTPDPATGSPKTFTRKNGEVGASYEIRADQIKFLDSRTSDNGNGNPQAQYAGNTTAPVQEEDDIPF